MEYVACGLYDDALLILEEAADNPMIYYAAAYACTKKGEREKASSYIRKAEAMKTDYCFPNRVAEIAILENAIATEKNCANACYYLGNLY